MFAASWLLNVILIILVICINTPETNVIYTISLHFFFHDTATTEIYTLSLHDALPILRRTPLGHSPRAEQPARTGKHQLERHRYDRQPEQSDQQTSLSRLSRPEKGLAHAGPF